MVYIFKFLKLLHQFLILLHAELRIPIGTPINDVKAETNSVTAETKINNCSMSFKSVESFLGFLLVKTSFLSLQWNNFLFHLFFNLNFSLMFSFFHICLQSDYTLFLSIYTYSSGENTQKYTRSIWNFTHSYY